MQDQELIELCKAIYRKHRDAIDLIVEYGAATNFQDACSDQLGALVDCEYISPTRGGIWFLPRALGDLLPPRPMAGWGFLPRNSPISCWCICQKKRGAVKMVIEVGPLADSEKRTALLLKLKDVGFTVRDKSLCEGAKFTRLISHSCQLGKDEDGEPDWSDDEIRKATKALWKKLEPTLVKLVEAIREFRWE